MLEEGRLAAELGEGGTKRRYGSSVMVVYRDPAGRDWAKEVSDRVKGLVGVEAVRSTWWKIGDLASPAVMAGAVSTAIRADVIVVSVHAAQVPPLPLCIWVDSWLPHRPHVPGALMALMAMPERPVAQADRVREYLRVVARQARLDFLVEERMLAAMLLAKREGRPTCYAS